MPESSEQQKAKNNFPRSAKRDIFGSEFFHFWEEFSFFEASLNYAEHKLSFFCFVFSPFRCWKLLARKHNYAFCHIAECTEWKCSGVYRYLEDDVMLMSFENNRFPEEKTIVRIRLEQAQMASEFLQFFQLTWTSSQLVFISLEVTFASRGASAWSSARSWHNS